MDVARVARLLWQQAGAQPGRYAEYWAKVESALAEARELQALQVLAELPLALPASLASQATASGSSLVPAICRQTAWEPQITRDGADGKPAALSARARIPRPDR